MAEENAERIRKYRVAVATISTASNMVAMHDIPELLAAIERGHSVGPILDPTLYRDKAKAMEEDAELLRAALPLWKLARKRLGETGEVA